MVYKLVIVDSDPAVAGWFESRLRPAGFEITSFTDGISALDMLSSLDPDLVLIEQDPKGIGLARFCDKLKQKSLVKKRPLILLTNAAAPLNDDQIRLSGATDFARKPLQAEGLIEKIKTHLSPSSTPARPASTPGPHRMTRDDQKEVQKIEELLGWSLPGEKTIMAAIDSAAPDAMADEDRTIVESSLRAGPKPAGPEAEAAPAGIPDDDRTILESDFRIARSRAGTTAEVPPEPTAIEPPPETLSFGPDPFTKEPEVAADLSMESVLSHGTMAEMAQDSVTAREWMPADSDPIRPEPAPTDPGFAAPQEPPAAPSPGPAPSFVSPDLVQSEVKRIVQEIIERVAWDVVPGMAETLIKEEIERLKSNRPS